MPSKMEFVNFKDFVDSLPAADDFATGDKSVLSGTTLRKMDKDVQLQKTAKNALDGNVATTFDATKQNDDDGYAYRIGETVTHDGKVYRFKKDKPSGAWDSDYVVQCAVGDVLESCYGDASYVRNYTPNFSQNGFYSRIGSFTSNTQWRCTDKLELSKIKKMTMQSKLKSIKISGFVGGTESVLANVAIWSVTNTVTSINIISSDEIQIPDDAKFIAFSTGTSVSSAKVYVTGDSSEMALETIRPGVVLKDTPYLSNYYCLNFADAVVGRYWEMRANALNGYYLQKVILNKGDKIFIPSANTYPAVTTKIVVTDIFGYVLSSDSISAKYTYTAMEDCIVYFPAMSSANTRCSITKANATDNIEGLCGSVVLLEKNKNEELRIVLPKYIDVPIGMRSDIFLDNAVGCEDNALVKPLVLIGDSSVKTVTKTHLYVEPTSGYGTKTVTATVYNDYFLLKKNSSKVISFRGVSRSGGDGSGKNICVCGDSLIANGVAADEVYSLLGADGDFDISQIGTISSTVSGNTVYHEGRSSWSFATYLNPAYETTPFDGRTNAFMYNGELDFQHYMETNFPQKSGIDIFVVSLGTNDVNQGVSKYGDESISNIVDRAKTFVDTLLSVEKGFPNCKVVIGLPAVGAPFFPAASASNDYFKMAILKLNEYLINTFDNGVYAQGVTCVPHGLFIDRENSYRYTEEPVTEFTTTTTRKYTDKVHPQNAGYRQWGRGYYGKIRAILNGNL